MTAMYRSDADNSVLAGWTTNICSANKDDKTALEIIQEISFNSNIGNNRFKK